MVPREHAVGALAKWSCAPMSAAHSHACAESLPPSSGPQALAIARSPALPLRMVRCVQPLLRVKDVAQALSDSVVVRQGPAKGVGAGCRGDVPEQLFGSRALITTSFGAKARVVDLRGRHA